MIFQQDKNFSTPCNGSLPDSPVTIVMLLFYATRAQGKLHLGVRGDENMLQFRIFGASRLQRQCCYYIFSKAAAIEVFENNIIIM